VETAKAPLVLSNDGSGVVDAGGPYAPGTRVAIYGGGQLGITEDGLQQQWVLVENKRLFPLPDNVDLDTGAALPINFITAYPALTRVGQVQPEQHVLVSGASGSVGQALIQLIAALGALPMAIVSSDEKAERALLAGARVVINQTTQDLQEAVLEATDGRGADLALDPVGGPMLGALLSAVRARGTVISIGFIAGNTASINLVDLVVHEKRLLGYDAWLESDSEVSMAFDVLTKLVASGAVWPVIDSIFSLEQYEAAYERLASRKAAGTILMRF
ncbi:MAG: zinc-binding dehydrogenase, partial [Comamonas sp.]|nr:zinc-binding dehydrogenase [Comamonas sp.]